MLGTISKLKIFEYSSFFYYPFFLFLFPRFHEMIDKGIDRTIKNKGSFHGYCITTSDFHGHRNLFMYKVRCCHLPILRET
jgi:hypothetical protein